MAHFLKVSATKIINIDKIARVYKSGNAVFVHYQGVTASVIYADEEAQILWDYLEATAMHLLEE